VQRRDDTRLSTAEWQDHRRASDREALDSCWFFASAIAAAVTVHAVTGRQPAPSSKFEAEKCYGISKAGENACQTRTRRAQGPEANGQRDGWVYVPKRTCDRPVNGGTQPQA
jgi:uncharacterized membrane protein